MLPHVFFIDSQDLEQRRKVLKITRVILARLRAVVTLEQR
jgi:hypothetical protein